jgi:hypothetical protein
MPSDRQHRHPKLGATPEERKIKTGGDPESLDKETITWQFHKLDQDHQRWALGINTPARVWREILRKLISFEGLTWAKLKEQCGGRRRGTNHHSLGIGELNAEARKRIGVLHLDQFDKFFSLRLTNTVRIYGVRDGRAMCLLWYDPYHGTRTGVCPTQ